MIVSCTFEHPYTSVFHNHRVWVDSFVIIYCLTLVVHPNSCPGIYTRAAGPTLSSWDIISCFPVAWEGSSIIVGPVIKISGFRQINPPANFHFEHCANLCAQAVWSWIDLTRQLGQWHQRGYQLVPIERRWLWWWFGRSDSVIDGLVICKHARYGGKFF